ncbi:STAS domain-containing protein [Psychrobacillus lasiicapitis]|uniref:STAS domain-containing protein n=1 Tax=Psychrobacillus lasiicapitis TaxID=1636719 RepID=A0A544TAT8_9BACI|nr:STAS domain-containing protein [Psychrobacillus lasiicapitis]TQR14573.1 STAS domain-containing protein [Psychrobacillus lasiicapitis]GGA30261.1 blue-light photoreceptor [Psychrobacillus lasiicapitis]
MNNKLLPINITGTDALNSIGENIIIADINYKIIWLNTYARKSLNSIAPWYNLSNSDDFIGLNMDFFHKEPSYQREVMSGLEKGHRARINIKNKFIADIVITPIKSMQEQNQEIVGYMVMLMDVTSEADEAKKLEDKVSELSTPMLHIWNNTIALTLVGEFDAFRGETLIPVVLEECISKGIEFVMVSLSGIGNFDDSVRQTLQKLHECLKLLGVQCIIVGIKPELAVRIGTLGSIVTFVDAHQGLKYIMKLQENRSFN